MDYIERSRVDVKTIKSVKRSDLGSDIPKKHSHSHSCNYEDDDFDYQLYKWGVGYFKRIFLKK